ncbi:DUF4352 domain-containing protein [Oceanobacillus manasiensis]|uniref:DUF4352 domain-containing protein n=1 Tax=Oceanobacillus manasiensis TaxID=586413 RepID=UPI0005AA7682|nr:DUF4352 domain-containing protein [Oceanobacillus manasiensis]
MKSKLTSFLIIVSSILILGACANEEDTKANEDEQNLNETMEGNSNKGEDSSDYDASEASTEDNNKLEEDPEKSEVVLDNQSDSVEISETTAGYGIETPDQIGLKVGDTGYFEDTAGTYDITVNSAELLDELDGEESQADHFFLMNITIKNTGEETWNAQDFLYGFRVTDDLESTGYGDYAESFDSVEQMTDDIAPNEESTGQFVTEVYDGDTYYFKLRSGITEGAGDSNNVVWEIAKEELQ